jgi:hypothetical protein
MMEMTPEQALNALQPWIANHRRAAWRPETHRDHPAPSDSAFSGLPFLLTGEDRPVCKPK